MELSVGQKVVADGTIVEVIAFHGDYIQVCDKTGRVRMYQESELSERPYQVGDIVRIRGRILYEVGLVNNLREHIRHVETVNEYRDVYTLVCAVEDRKDKGVKVRD